MASTFTSDGVASTVVAKTGSDMVSVTSTYEISAALVISDVIQMVKIPKNAVIDEVILATDDLESSGTTCTLDVGDDGDADRYIAASTVGQAGGFARMNNIAGLGYCYTAENTIDVTVSAAPTTGATSGTITLTVLYHMK